MLYVSLASAAVHRRKGSWAMSALARAIFEHALTHNSSPMQWELQGRGGEPRSDGVAQVAAAVRALAEIVLHRGDVVVVSASRPRGPSRMLGIRGAAPVHAP